MTRRKKYTTTWEGPAGRAKIEIAHTEEYSEGRDHIEVRVRHPKDAPLPITQSGYLSHFISATELAKAGGPARYVNRLLIDGAKSPAWKRHVVRLSQPDLFQGAAEPAPPPRTSSPEAHVTAKRPANPRASRRRAPPSPRD